MADYPRITSRVFLPPLDGREATVSEDATGHVRRRLAAILFAGYNRLQPGDAADTFAGLILLQTEIIEPQVLKCGGNIIRWTGDGTLIEIESVVEACAAPPLCAMRWRK